MKAELLNGANLAFIGDAYYELFIRRRLLEKEITNQNELQKLASGYVSAKAQHLVVSKLVDLSPEEIAIFKRGRNHKFRGFRKNLKKEEYLNSTGFEALIGYHYLKGNFQRLHELLDFAVAVIEGEHE
ncbi:MAG: ribonuclease III domain-containing protein [Bacilli bacterium]|jgi:ribonuclease-3 family protein|nr:Mini-ribonuclease 3 [Acholeplasmataceae bacterium]